MKTIAHLLPNYNPFPPVYPAGTELRVAQVSRRQSRYRPVVVCGGFPGQPNQETVDAMEIRRIHFSRVYRRLFQKITRLNPWPYGRRMWNIIRDEGTALLHIHNEPKLLAMLAPYLRATPIPVVVHIANDKPIPAELVPLVTHWVACSQYMAQWLHEHTGVPHERIDVIHTGVDITARPPRWDISSTEQAERRARWGVSPDDYVFLFAGRLVKEKGVVEMLDAFERLKRERPVKLLVAGNVRESKDPGNEKAVYGRAVSERMAGMADVRWVGSLHPDAMHDFLLAGDAFLLPSLWHDPFPTVMLEAACAGLPILAGRRGGITEFLEGCPGVGLLHDPGDADELAAAMSALAANPESGMAAGHWLRAKIEADFDWSRVARDFENLYDRQIGRASCRERVS
jgi:glycosyltransferase involved in cell wall biosynthesis